MRILSLLPWRRKSRRNIYRFRPPTGGAWQYRDPVVIRERLNAKNPTWSDLVGAVAAGSKPLPEKLTTGVAGIERMAEMRRTKNEEMTKELAELVSDAFEAPALKSDGSGWSRAELINLLAEYLEWCSALMEQTRPLAFTPPATDSAGGGIGSLTVKKQD